MNWGDIKALGSEALALAVGAVGAWVAFTRQNRIMMENHEREIASLKDENVSLRERIDDQSNRQARQLNADREHCDRRIEQVQDLMQRQVDRIQTELEAERTDRRTAQQQLADAYGQMTTLIRLQGGLPE